MKEEIRLILKLLKYQLDGWDNEALSLRKEVDALLNPKTITHHEERHKKALSEKGGR